MGHWAMNHRLIQLILEDVLLDGKSLFEILQSQLTHVHDCADIELVHPMGHFVDS